jgi:thioredoxin 1
MAVLDLDESNFAKTVGGDGIVLVDCWAPWCGACKDFAPVFERAAERHPAHTFGKFNTQEHKKYTSELGILHVPTLMLFRDGVLLLKQPGYCDEESLLDIISQAEVLDMDEVRLSIERERARRSMYPT